MVRSEVADELGILVRYIRYLDFLNFEGLPLRYPVSSIETTESSAEVPSSDSFSLPLSEPDVDEEEPVLFFFLCGFFLFFI